jgi:multimeric flavodoxin WrbA
MSLSLARKTGDVPKVYYTLGGTHIVLLYDASALGCRFGMMCAQMKAFFDATGGHWQKGSLVSGNSSAEFSTTWLHSHSYVIAGMVQLYTSRSCDNAATVGHTVDLLLRLLLVFLCLVCSQAGKAASMFTSTATQGSGQETTILTAVTQLAHHGMIYVPTGYGSGGAMFGLDAPKVPAAAVCTKTVYAGAVQTLLQTHGMQLTHWASILAMSARL